MDCVELEKAFNDFEKTAVPPRTSSSVIIIPIWFFKLRPKPKYYRMYTKRMKLKWLKTRRRLSLAIECLYGINFNAALWRGIKLIKQDVQPLDGRIYDIINQKFWDIL